MDGCLAVVCFVYSTAYRYNIYEEFVRRSQVSTSRGDGRDCIPYLYEFTEALEPPTAILRQQRDKARYLRLSRSDRQLSSLPNSQSAQQSIFSFAIDTQRARLFYSSRRRLVRVLYRAMSAVQAAARPDSALKVLSLVCPSIPPTPLSGQPAPQLACPGGMGEDRLGQRLFQLRSNANTNMSARNSTDSSSARAASSRPTTSASMRGAGRGTRSARTRASRTPGGCRSSCRRG